jgi:hypothetical protein
MKKLMLLFVLAGLSMRDIQSLDLVKVGAWTHKDEYWDEKNKSLGLKGTKYLYTLINNHVLCSEWRETDFPSYDTLYYIKNYLTGEITYRFEKGIRFYGVEDQYGAYIFL